MATNSSHSNARNDGRSNKSTAGQNASKGRGGSPAGEVDKAFANQGSRKQSYSASSSRDGSRAGTPSKQTTRKGESENGARHMHDRLLYLLIHLVDETVTIVLKDGSKFIGKLSSALTEGDLGVELKDARQLRPAIAEDAVEAISMAWPTLILQAKDVMEIYSQNVELNGLGRQHFKTDTEISASLPIRERQLEKWSSGEGTNMLTLEDSLNPHRNDTSWDQFEANERMFGIKTNFKEELYTTKLDKAHPEYGKREQDANRLAREIESSSTSNPHIREERGLTDDSGLDEEEKYSGVTRGDGSAIRDTTKYAVEQRANGKGDRNIETPTDPAIISAQLARQERVTRTGTENSRQEDKKQTLVLPTSKSAGKTSPEIEKEFMGTFKQFVSGERERLHQKKQAHLKREKDGRLQELMKFSQSFKLKTPVPADLVPILAKDKLKQEEIVQKSVASAASAVTPKQDASKIPVRSAEAPLPATVAAPKHGTLTQRLTNVRALNGIIDKPTSPPGPLASQSKPGLRFNANAMEFKPNPSASPNPNPTASSFNPPIQTNNASMSPSSSHASAQASRPTTPSVFFGSQKPKAGNRTKITDAFNPFIHAKRINPGLSEAQFDKPYIFTPIWPAGEHAGDKSYNDLFLLPRSQLSSPTPHFSDSSVEQQLRPSASPPVIQSPHLQHNAPFNPMYAQQQMAFGVPAGYGQYRGFAQGFVPMQNGPAAGGPISYIPASPYMQFAVAPQAMYSPQQQQMFIPAGYSPGRGGAMMMPQNSGQGVQPYPGQPYGYQNPKMMRYPSDMMNSSRASQGQQGPHRSSFGSGARPSATSSQPEKPE